VYACVDVLGIPAHVVDLSGGDGLQVLVLRDRVACGGDQLEVVSVKLVRNREFGVDQRAQAPPLDICEILPPPRACGSLIRFPGRFRQQGGKPACGVDFAAATTRLMGRRTVLSVSDGLRSDAGFPY
jgi:hypothetical protein